MEDKPRQRSGLSPQEPTPEQVKAIEPELIELFVSAKTAPTEEQIGAVVKKHCKTFQQFKHADDDD
ncbi:hypothetical protein [Myxococcus eversor]|nr:hypothetical protein [Myxococcus eversor]